MGAEWVEGGGSLDYQVHDFGSGLTRQDEGK